MIGNASLRAWIAVSSLSISSLVGSAAFDSAPWHAATPKPKVPDADSVTPGLWGFVVTFLIAVVTVLLIMDMVRRIRRTRYRAEIAEKLDAEAAQSDAAGTAQSGQADDQRPVPPSDD
jgi:hypothetical protein